MYLNWHVFVMETTFLTYKYCPVSTSFMRRCLNVACPLGDDTNRRICALRLLFHKAEQLRLRGLVLIWKIYRVAALTVSWDVD